MFAHYMDWKLPGPLIVVIGVLSVLALVYLLSSAPHGLAEVDEPPAY